MGVFMQVFRQSCWFVLFLVMPFAHATAVLSSDVTDRREMSLTVYEHDRALVRERRQLSLPSGNVSVRFSGISDGILPETVMLLDGDGRSVDVGRIAYDHERLSPRTLLAAHVGKTVRIVRTDPVTGRETEENARILSVQDGVVLEIGDRIETGLPGRLVFDRLPDGLNNDSSLTVEWENRTGYGAALELDYLTRGISWQADYVARFDEENDAMSLSGRAALANNSGMSLKDVKVTLVAGNLNRVSGGESVMMSSAGMKRDALPVANMVPGEGSGDYYRYELPGKVTLPDRQLCQYALFNAGSVKVKRKWVLEGESYYYRSSLPGMRRTWPVVQRVEWKNSSRDGLGFPIPAGIVRFYQADRHGNMQFAGESRVPHMPVGESASLSMGESFHVTASRKQLRFERIAVPSGAQPRYDSSYEIRLRNAKDRPVIVQVREPVPGKWQIISENVIHRRDGMTAVWDITVPAAGEAVLRYTVRVE